MSKQSIRYKRVLVKLSGEALMGSGEYGIDPAIIKRIALEIQEILALGVEVAVVIGGGNIFRGAGLARAGMDRVTGDHMGMLATVMNCLAMQDALEAIGTHARVMSAIAAAGGRQAARLWREMNLLWCGYNIFLGGINAANVLILVVVFYDPFWLTG